MDGLRVCTNCGQYECQAPATTCWRCREQDMIDAEPWLDDMPIVDTTPICWTCGEKMEWTSEYREIELEGGFMGTIYDPIYECPYCDYDDEDTQS